MAEGKSSVLVPVLALAVAGLGYLNYGFFNLNVDTTPVAPTAASTADKTQGAKDLVLAPSQHAIDEFPLTASHPIFFANRRPPEKPKPKPVAVAEAKAPAAPLQPLEPLQLVGIIGAGAGRQALVRTSADPQGTWLSVGDEFRGWQLREVMADNVVVEARGQRSELHLYASGTGKPAKP